MPINIPAPTGGNNTAMDVIAAAIRENLNEPLISPATDGTHFTNAMIITAVNRAVKTAVGKRQGVKSWLPVATTAGVAACALPNGTMTVYQVNYLGKPLLPLTTYEKDTVIAAAEMVGSVTSYSIDGDPISQITLMDAPGTAGTTDLKVHALYYPSAVTDLTGGSTSPLPPYYDDFVIDFASFRLLEADGGADAERYLRDSKEDIQIITGIEEPRVKDPMGDRIVSIESFYSGE